MWQKSQEKEIIMKWIKRKLLNLVMRRLWKAISVDDFETSFNNLSKEKKTNLFVQANDLENMYIVEWLSREMIKLSVKKLYEAQKPDDIIFAQACIWSEYIRQKKINNLAKQLKNYK